MATILGVKIYHTLYSMMGRSYFYIIKQISSFICRKEICSYITNKTELYLKFFINNAHLLKTAIKQGSIRGPQN